MIWAGEETPCALGVVCSIGSINQENNAALTAAISELIEPFGVSSDRIYLNVCQPRRPRYRVTARTRLPACLTYTLLALLRGVAVAGDAISRCLAPHAVLRCAARELRLVRTHLRRLRSGVFQKIATRLVQLSSSRSVSHVYAKRTGHCPLLIQYSAGFTVRVRVFPPPMTKHLTGVPPVSSTYCMTHDNHTRSVVRALENRST